MSDSQKPGSPSKWSKEISGSGGGKVFKCFVIPVLPKRGQEKEERVCENPQEGKLGSLAQSPNSTSEMVLLLLFLAPGCLWYMGEPEGNYGLWRPLHVSI